MLVAAAVHSIAISHPLPPPCHEEMIIGEEHCKEALGKEWRRCPFRTSGKRIAVRRVRAVHF